MFGTEETIILAITILIVSAHYKRIGYINKQIVIHLVPVMIVQSFSLLVLTSAVMVDEPQYFEKFIDVNSIKETTIPLKLIYDIDLAS